MNEPLKPCSHEWGLYSGYMIVTKSGIYELKYVCFKCQKIETIEREYVRSNSANGELK